MNPYEAPQTIGATQQLASQASLAKTYALLCKGALRELITAGYLDLIALGFGVLLLLGLQFEVQQGKTPASSALILCSLNFGPCLLICGAAKATLGCFKLKKYCAEPEIQRYYRFCELSPWLNLILVGVSMSICFQIGPDPRRVSSYVVLISLAITGVSLFWTITCHARNFHYLRQMLELTDVPPHEQQYSILGSVTSVVSVLTLWFVLPRWNNLTWHYALVAIEVVLVVAMAFQQLWLYRSLIRAIGRGNRVAESIS